MEIQTMIGQRLAFGFRETTLTQDFIDMVREYKIGNVILFYWNIINADQLRQLCRDIQGLIQEETGHPAFITIDQEGGMVHRLSPDLVNVPGNMAAVAAGTPETAYCLAQITARQLRGTGVNLNLAPVLDVNNNPANPVIGTRSYGDDPQRVAEFGAAAVRGYAESCLMCCGKHFPGHGDTAVDSHLGLPLIDKSLAELRKNELIPFQAAIDAGIPAIMSSHILFPQIEPKRIPATMSRRIMHDLLRDEMGFQGLILSDTMEMDAIRKHYGTPLGMIGAMNAGIDLVFVSRFTDVQHECLPVIRRAVENGDISLDNLTESYERILAFKKKYAFTQAEPDLASHPEDFAAARETACDAVVLYSGKHYPLKKNTFFCGPKDYRMTDADNEADKHLDFVGQMAKKIGIQGCECSVDPTAEEIEMITAEAGKHDNIVLGTCNAHLFCGQLALAASLAKTGKPLTVIALRDPYDLSELPDCTAKAAVFDYTIDGLYAAEQFLLTGNAPGCMPVRI